MFRIIDFTNAVDGTESSHYPSAPKQLNPTRLLADVQPRGRPPEYALSRAIFNRGSVERKITQAAKRVFGTLGPEIRARIFDRTFEIAKSEVSIDGHPSIWWNMNPCVASGLSGDRPFPAR